MTALIFSVFSLISTSTNLGIANSLKQLNWASYLLGISAFGLEIGYLYVYRSGWNIAIAPICVSIFSTILLIVFSIFVYNTKLTFTNALGVCISILGLILMNKK
jgi:uncharacterized membrane protein